MGLQYVLHLSGQPIPLLRHSDSKEVLLCVCMELPGSSFCLLPHVLLLHSSKKSPAPTTRLPSDIYKQCRDALSALSSPDRTAPGLSAFPHMGDAPGPSSSLWLSAALFLGDLCLL